MQYSNRYRLTNWSRKDIEEIYHARVFCLMYKLISSSKGSDDLSTGFHRENESRGREMINNKVTKGN